MIPEELKIGDRVIVTRKIGPDDNGTEVTGVIDRFSNTIRIGGEMTAWIKYDDGVSPYWHPLSKIKLITN